MAGEGIRGRRITGLAVAGAAALTVAGYAGSLRAPFVGDDAEALLWALGTDESVLPRANPHLRPVTLLSLRANHAVGGLDPLGYHLLNLGLHLVAGVLVALLAAALLRRTTGGDRRRSRCGGALAAFVFLLLPTHTEAVSWVIGRSYVLASIGALVALWVWFRGEQDAPGVPAAVLAVTAFVAGLLANEVIAPLPVVVSVLAVACGIAAGGDGRRVRAVLRPTIPLYLVLGLYLGVRRMVLGTVTGTYEAEGAYDVHPVRLAGRSVLLVTRSVLPGMGRGGWLVAGAAVALAAVVALTVARHRPSSTWVPEGWLVGGLVLAALLAALPGAGLGVSVRDSQGERLAYLVSALAAVALAVPSSRLILSLIGRDRGRARGAWVAGLTVALIGAVVLSGIDGRWASAGQVAGAVYEDGPAFDDQDRGVVLVGAPDLLQGVYVGRNATRGEAVLRHGWTTPERARDLVPVTLTTVDGGVALRRPDPAVRLWELTLLPGTTFAGVPGTSDLTREVPGVHVRRLGVGRLELRIEPEVDLRSIWYYSSGGLLPLAAGAP